MKVIIKRFFLVVAFSACILPIWAQSPTVLPDVKHQYNYLPNVKCSIIRSIEDTTLEYNTITCNQLEAGGNTGYSHCFIARRFTSGVSRVFYMPVVSYFSEPTQDKITDMRVLGKYCYFCGRRKYITGYTALSNGPDQPTIYVPEYDSLGFMGYFDIRDLSSDENNVELYFRTIPEIKTAKRMRAFYDEGGPGKRHVVLLGEGKHEGTTKSCLVELSTGSNSGISFANSWNYYIEYLNTPGQVLTDIEKTDDYLVLSSIYSSDNTILGFHYMKLGDIDVGFHGSSTGADVFKYNLMNLVVPGGCGVLSRTGAIRHSDSPVLLTPRGAGFVAGFDGEENSRDEIVRGEFFAFAMDDPATMTEAVVAVCGNNSKLRDLSYIPAFNQVAVLTTKLWAPPSHPVIDAAFQFIKLGTVSVGECYENYDVLYHIDGDIFSIDVNQGSSVSYSGRLNETKKPFDGNFNFNNTCLDYYQYGSGMLRVATIPYILESCEWVRSSKAMFMVTYTDRPVSTELSQNCYHP